MTNPVLRRPVRWFAATMLLVMGALLALANPAFAHDKFVGSSPTDKATVHAAPTRVTIRFEEPPGNGFSGISVIGPDGKNLGIGTAKIVGSTLTIPVKKTSSTGLFTVKYHIISDDGHPVSGTVHFTVSTKPKPSATVTSPSASPVAKTTTQGSDHGWIAILGSAVVLFAIVGLLAKRGNANHE